MNNVMMSEMIRSNSLLNIYHGPPKNYYILIPGVFITVYFCLQELFMYKKTKLNFHRYYSIFFALLLCSWCLMLISIFLNLRPRTSITFIYGAFIVAPFLIGFYFLPKAIKLHRAYKKTSK